MSGEVRSTWVSFAITLSAQPISYHNQHSLTQPHCNFLLFPLIFCPNEICLIVVFTFILLTCNKPMRSVLLKSRKNNLDTKHFFSTKKELPICPINKQKANSLTVFNISFERMNFASTEWYLFGKLFRLISLTKQRKNTIPSKFPVFRGEVQKVFWNTTLFCRHWFHLLSALIF